jgi:pilus assembly protein Flp/PilA
MTYLNNFVAKIAYLRSDRRAVTALEYGLIASLIALVIIGSVTTLGTNMKTTFTTIGNSL